jgi:hypothetical protein
MGTRTSFLRSSGASLAQKSLTSLYLSCRLLSARRSPLPRPFLLAVARLDGSCRDRRLQGAPASQVLHKSVDGTAGAQNSEEAPRLGRT